MIKVSQEVFKDMNKHKFLKHSTGDKKSCSNYSITSKTKHSKAKSYYVEEPTYYRYLNRDKPKQNKNYRGGNDRFSKKTNRV